MEFPEPDFSLTGRTILGYKLTINLREIEIKKSKECWVHARASYTRVSKYLH